MSYNVSLSTWHSKFKACFPICGFLSGGAKWLFKIPSGCTLTTMTTTPVGSRRKMDRHKTFLIPLPYTESTLWPCVGCQLPSRASFDPISMTAGHLLGIFSGAASHRSLLLWQAFLPHFAFDAQRASCDFCRTSRSLTKRFKSHNHEIKLVFVHGQHGNSRTNILFSYLLSGILIPNMLFTPEVVVI